MKGTPLQKALKNMNPPVHAYFPSSCLEAFLKWFLSFFKAFCLREIIGKDRKYTLTSMFPFVRGFGRGAEGINTVEPVWILREGVPILFVKAGLRKHIGEDRDIKLPLTYIREH